jgi:hypothetical protein
VTCLEPSTGSAGIRKQPPPGQDLIINVPDLPDPSYGLPDWPCRPGTVQPLVFVHLERADCVCMSGPMRQRWKPFPWVSEQE